MLIGIVGCGVAGQAAATLLSESGHDVTIFERFAEPRPLGAGLLLQPTGLAVLGELGLREQALAAGAKVTGLKSVTQSGRPVLDLSYADLHPAAHGLGIHRGRLFDLLHGALKRSPAKLVTAHEIVDVARGQIVDKAGGRHGPFDLVIVADGAHSALRQRLMPEAKAPLYPWGCLWATVPDPAGIGASGLLQQRVRGTTEMMGLLPVGDRQLTLYWSVPAEGQPDIDAFHRAATALWPEAAAAVEHAVRTNGLTHATYRHVALPRWTVDGKVLFIGDAAHGTSPQLGQGANLGLMDAWTLADAIARNKDLEAALTAFAVRRRSTVRFYRQASHLLTPLFQSNVESFGWMRDAFMGTACRLPVARTIAATTLAGLRISWLFSSRLDAEGRYRLDA